MIRKMTRTKLPSMQAIVILAILFSIFFISLPAPVIHANSVDNMIPSCPKGDPACKNQASALYNKYGVSKYAFQTLTDKRSVWNVGAKAADTINSIYDHSLSTVFLIGVQITRFFNFIVREAFTFGFMNTLIDGISEMIGNLTGVSNGSMGKGLWDSMFGIFAGATLLYMLWQMIRFRFLETFQTAISFILALVIALSFFSQAGTVLKFINNAATELGDTIYTALAVPGGLSGNTSDGITAVSNQVWMELVIKPYSMLQYDDSSAYEKTPAIIDSVLKTDPYSDERIKALEKAKTTYPAVAKIRSDEQMLILLCNAVFGLIIIGFLSFWSLASIYARLKLLLHAVFMAITLLASLLPGREASLSVVRSQFIKLIGLSLTTTVTFFFLDLSIVMGHMAFNVVYNSGAGWFVAMLVDAIMIFVVFKYRNEIGNVFTKAVGAVPMQQKAKSTLLDAVQRNVTRSIYKKAGGAVSGLFNRKEHEGVPSKFNPNSIHKAGDNLNDATTASMQLRFQREKTAAEDHANESGQPVQYTPFVKRVNDNMLNGTKNPFRGMDKEWKEEKTRLKEIKDDGGDVKQAILTQGVNEGMNDQQVASTMYTNENAIRQASMYMIDRPKKAVNQIKRAGTLNKNRKLETTVDDFCMIELFQRYKVEYKQAMDTSNVTGEPVKHTDFVNKMDTRFKNSGLNTTQKVNKFMLSRKGRIAAAPAFQNMPEFTQKRDDLLRANEAFLKATAPQEGVPMPITELKRAPLSNGAAARLMPAMPNARSPRELQLSNPGGVPTVVKQDIPITVLANGKVQASVDMTRVRLPENLKKSMSDATAGLARTVAALEPGEKFQIDTVAKTAVLINMKEKVSAKMSSDLNSVSKELEVMRRANGTKLTEATVNHKHKEIEFKVAKNAQTTRMPKSRKRVENNSSS
ncbi:CD3337/EF1877 family mobilome membrane protein [Paenibacillus sp. 2TAB26]|uniref:CD3337/EF1877 family mobilome membrane protein n=1 Tax=Paenibacillus sp. 2TAB26 TaxID=3233005 RepID=UPI003F9C8FF5